LAVLSKGFFRLSVRNLLSSGRKRLGQGALFCGKRNYIFGEIVVVDLLKSTLS
jgi:hypothetical protein